MPFARGAVRGSIVSDTSAAPEATEAEPVEAVPATSAPVKKTRAKKVVAEPVAEPSVESSAAPDAAPQDAGAVAAPETLEPVDPAAPSHQVIYVEAPKPFLAKGNRGFGVLIAILSTIIFAVVYAGIAVIVELANGGSASFDFVGTGDFWSPVVAFGIGFVILVLIVNRAGWAAHVIGSLFVGAFAYFVGSAGFLLFHLSQIPSNEGTVVYKAALLSVPAIVAGLLAREVALWMGFAIAARGRKVKARNVEARVVYDQEIADKKAEYEAGVAPTS